MIINYLCWSTLISLVAIFLLYPLRHHAQGARVTRISAALFLFPSLVLALVAQLLIAKNDVIFISIARLALVKIQFGFQISQNNIPLIIAINALMLLLIATLSHRRFSEYCSIASLSALFIFIVAATPDQLVRISAFSLGTIMLSCALISQEIDARVINILTKDFILNRLSDFLAFTALIHVLLQFNVSLTNEINLATNDVGFMHNFLFFSAIVLRLISFTMVGSLKASSISANKMIIFYRLLLGTCAQTLLLFYAELTPGDAKHFNAFLVMSVLPFAYALITSFYNRERIYSPNNLATFLFTANLIIILCGARNVAVMIMCILIALYPSASLLYSKRIPDMKEASTRTLQHTFGLYAKKMVAFFARVMILIAQVFVNFFNIIYAGFILYRLPQFLLLGLQMPLRFLNNGSVQRSLIFVVMLLLAYTYWWGES